MPEPLRLLIVCLGNICRSPMAEGVLRSRLEAAALGSRVELDSAGTGDWHVGNPPDPRAIATGRRYGVELGSLCGRQVCAADFDRFDWLLCADRSNLRDLQMLAPAGSRARAALLLEWAGVGEGDGQIPDPYTGDRAGFEHVWQLLERAADGVVERIKSRPFE